MRQISRREALKLAALSTGAAGWTVIAPRRVFSSEANSRIRLGVIGCGGRGRWITNLFAKHGGYEIHAVADYFQEVADASGDQFGVEKGRRFSGLSGFVGLLQTDIEAVALETPPYCFPQHAAAAVAAGRHVYMAKPVAVDVPGTLAIGRLGKQSTDNRRCFFVDFQIPTDPLNIEAVRRVHEGAIGKVAMVKTHYLAGRFSDPAKTATAADRLRHLVWVNDVDLGGSYHVNACIHAVDGGLWLLGRARPVAASGVSSVARPDPHGDSHDQYSLTFEFSDGRLLSHTGSHLKNQFDVRCVAFGQDGTAEIGYTGSALVRGGSQPYEGGEIAGLYAAGAERNIAAFHKNVTEGDYSNPTVEPSVTSNLTTILGREAGRRQARLTMNELVQENQRIEPDLRGLAAREQARFSA